MLFHLLSIFPDFCNHQIVISIAVSSLQRSYIEYTPMPSPIYQYLTNLVVSLPIRSQFVKETAITVHNINSSQYLRFQFSDRKHCQTQLHYLFIHIFIIPRAMSIIPLIILNLLTMEQCRIWKYPFVLLPPTFMMVHYSIYKNTPVTNARYTFPVRYYAAS